MTDPASEGEAAARRDAQREKEAEAGRNAARTIALASIKTLREQLAVTASYLEQGEFFAALGTLQGIEEEFENVRAATRLLRMSVR
jgi:hypothetical protein